jgi:hypothetical protein
MAIRAALVAVIVASLLVPAAAAAKEVQSVQLCGASECFTFDRANSGDKLMLFEGGGRPASAPRRAAPWYRLLTRIGDPGMEPVVFTSAYVPSAGLIRFNDEGGGGYVWYQVDPDLRPVLRNVAARLAPRSPASLHVNDLAPGVPAPTAAPARRQPRESGAGSVWLVALAAAAAASGALLIARARRHGRPPAAG